MMTRCVNQSRSQPVPNPFPEWGDDPVPQSRSRSRLFLQSGTGLGGVMASGGFAMTRGTGTGSAVRDAR